MKCVSIIMNRLHSHASFPAAAISSTSMPPFTSDDIALICNELHGILTKALTDAAQSRVETFQGTVEKWRTLSQWYCERLIMRGWDKDDAVAVTLEKNRLADMLESASKQLRASAVGLPADTSPGEESDSRLAWRAHRKCALYS